MQSNFKAVNEKVIRSLMSINNSSGFLLYVGIAVHLIFVK